MHNRQNMPTIEEQPEVTRKQSKVWLVILLFAPVLLAGLCRQFPLMQNIQHRARTAKVQQDTRAIASALTQYSAHCGDLPAEAGDTCAPGGVGMAALIVVQTNGDGQTVGPWFASPGPIPSSGWDGYAINIPGPKGPGTFQVVATPTNGDNDGDQVTAP